ncbi:MAG: hypothetical protein ACI81W_002869, partial [Saprospiraceae bacterium]
MPMIWGFYLCKLVCSFFFFCHELQGLTRILFRDF